MTVVCREAFQSRPSSTSGGANFGTRTFHVYDDGDGSSLLSSLGVRLLFGTATTPDALPTYGEQFPGAVSPFVAYDHRVEPMEGQPGGWTVTWIYRDSATFAGSNLQPHDVGFIEFSADGQAVFEEQWRSVTGSTLLALVATGGTYANGSPTGDDLDIGGTPIDMAGIPVSGPLRKTVEFRISETRDELVNMWYLMSFVGRRNNTAFGGAPIGTVVYVKPSLSRIGPFKYRYTHTFVLDNYYHLIQTPFRNPDGTVELGTTGDTEGKADIVSYRQPFPNFANHYAISPYFVGAF